MISQLCSVFFASLNSSIIFILLLLFKAKILQHIGARWYYYLWFTLFIPWISIWLPVDFSLANTVHINIAPLIKYITPLILKFTVTFSISPIKLTIYIWLTGVFLSLFYTSYC